MPEDYALFRAARWLGVPPWELARQPLYYQNRALDFEKAEARADEIYDEIVKARKGGDDEEDD